ncbi:glutathione S-transferase theta-1-like [Pseudophryne corroboree]|uniref:glutathione S-transferase theta-1-like n=1 Tax=Pseudophryne corroboree TaxID=495146 RepID=UPI0030818CCC
MTPYLLGHEATPDKLDPAVAEYNNTLKNIEEYFLQDKPFLAGDEISIADLVAIVEIMQPVGAGIDVFEGKPKLSAWKHRVQEAVGAELFNEAHEAVLHAKDMKNRPIPPELKERLKDCAISLPDGTVLKDEGYRPAIKQLPRCYMLAFTTCLQ